VLIPNHPAGRYWGSADSGTLTRFSSGDAFVRLDWSDGKYIVQDFDSPDDAIAFLHRLGFAEQHQS
jgi:hypothetical protein